jgi:hypothetical protein
MSEEKTLKTYCELAALAGLQVARREIQGPLFSVELHQPDKNGA